MTKIDTIVLDIDGTLLNKDKAISKCTKEALIQVQEHGIKVILASGRPTNGMHQLAHELEMDKHHGFLISFNGACVTDCQDNSTLYAQPIDSTVVKDLLEHLKHFDVIPMVAHKSTMYVNDVYGGMIDTVGLFGTTQPVNIIEYESRGGQYLLCEQEDLAAFVDFPLYKILVAGNPNYLQAHHKDIMKPFVDLCNGVFSAPFYFEFTDKGIDKATTLNKVLAPLGHGADAIMAFGDGHNDISMLKYAGIGVAMGNAEDEVKRIADKVTKSNNEDGIAYMLMQTFPQIFNK